MLIRLALYVSGHRPTIDRVSSPVEGAARSLAEGEPEDIVVRVIDDRAIVIGAPSGAKRSRWGRWISDLTRGEFASLLATRVTVQRPSGTTADTGRAYGRRWRGGGMRPLHRPQQFGDGWPFWQVGERLRSLDVEDQGVHQTTAQPCGDRRRLGAAPMRPLVPKGIRRNWLKVTPTTRSFSGLGTGLLR